MRLNICQAEDRFSRTRKFLLSFGLLFWWNFVRAFFPKEPGTFYVVIYIVNDREHTRTMFKNY